MHQDGGAAPRFGNQEGNREAARMEQVNANQFRWIEVDEKRVEFEKHRFDVNSKKWKGLIVEKWSFRFYRR